MHRKEIKKIVKDQLKSEYMHRRSLRRKEKKSIAKKVVDERGVGRACFLHFLWADAGEHRHTAACL